MLAAVNSSLDTSDAFLLVQTEFGRATVTPQLSLYFRNVMRIPSEEAQGREPFLEKQGINREEQVKWCG
jgi:hypothetical protein